MSDITENIPEFQNHINEALNVLYKQEKFIKLKDLVMCLNSVPTIIFDNGYNMLHIAIINHTALNETYQDFPFIRYLLSKPNITQLINKTDNSGNLPIKYAKDAGLDQIVNEINKINGNNNVSESNNSESNDFFQSELKTVEDEGKSFLNSLKNNIGSFTNNIKNDVNTFGKKLSNNYNKINQIVSDTLQLGETPQIANTETVIGETEIFQSPSQAETSQITESSIEIKGGANAHNKKYEKYIMGMVDNVKNTNIDDYANNFNENGLMDGGKFRRKKIDPKSIEINTKIIDTIKKVAPNLDENHYATVKYALYKKVKEENPDLKNSIQQSEAVIKLITKKNIDNINLEKMAKERQKAYDERIKLRTQKKLEKKHRPKKSLMKTPFSTTESTTDESSSNESSSNESSSNESSKKTKKTKK